MQGPPQAFPRTFSRGAPAHGPRPPRAAAVPGRRWSCRQSVLSVCPCGAESRQIEPHTLGQGPSAVNSVKHSGYTWGASLPATGGGFGCDRLWQDPLHFTDAAFLQRKVGPSTHRTPTGLVVCLQHSFKYRMSSQPVCHRLINPDNDNTRLSAGSP